MPDRVSNTLLLNHKFIITPFESVVKHFLNVLKKSFFSPNKWYYFLVPFIWFLYNIFIFGRKKATSIEVALKITQSFCAFQSFQQQYHVM